jgi:cell wall-associated NlpC family hydrolase
MSFQKIIFIITIIYSSFCFSQENIKHKVQKGETVYSLAQKYNVTQANILTLNPKANNGLKLDMVLQIPTKNSQKVKTEALIHEVLPKETLYGISKKYNVTIDRIKAANPFIETEGLKIGAKITIPEGKLSNYEERKPVINADKVVLDKKEQVVSTKEYKVENINNGSEIIHDVMAKETKYGISKKYGVSIAELELLNPKIKAGLAIGDKVIIKKGNKVDAVDSNKSVNNLPEKPKEITSSEIIVTEKPKGQLKIVGKVPSDKNEEIVVKPQIEEELEEMQPELPIAEEVAPMTEENVSKADFLISKASENIGVRYRSGGTSNAGFDCSGLMINTFNHIELKLPRSSRDMAMYGTRIDKNQAQKGDLIFFATMGKGRVSHVGLVVEVIDDEIKFIHSSTSSGVIISSSKEAYYAKRFVQVNRVLE